MSLSSLTKSDLFDGNRPVLIAGGVSLLLILGALAFEHIGGLAPCKLCLTQRMPHYGLIALALISLAIPKPQIILRAVAALCALATGAVGIQHVGVEQGWWQGPQGCSAQIGNGDLSSLTDALLATAVVRCDEIAWSLMGISMAGWNAIISLAIAGFLVYSLGMLRKGLKDG